MYDKSEAVLSIDRASVIAVSRCKFHVCKVANEIGAIVRHERNVLDSCSKASVLFHTVLL